MPESTAVLPTPEGEPKSWKVMIRTNSDTDWSGDQMRYRTKKDADAAGAALFARWMAVELYMVQPSEDEPND